MMAGMLTETPAEPVYIPSALDPQTDRTNSFTASEPRSNVVYPHWERPIKKCLWTLNIGPKPGERYAPEICELTYPLFQNFAKKIGADFKVITERKFPGWPVVYEKLQLHELGRDYDWTIFLDSDALVSPEAFDWTNHLSKDTVAHNGRDMAGVRWKYDQYFRRDGRHWGSCNWCTIASDWCLDIWRPLDDLTLEQAMERINITITEHNSAQCETSHLIDDFTLSRNIARFGLKTQTLMDLHAPLGWRDGNGRGISPHLFHLYTIPMEEKIKRMLMVLATPNGQVIIDPKNANQALGVGWGLMDPGNAQDLAKKWNLK